MKKNIVLVAVVALLSGCASVAPTVQSSKDQEPILVGLPMKEKIAIASKDINNQMDLLSKVNGQKYVGSYKLVTHNNDLDARKGSSRTLPPQVEEKKVAPPVEAPPPVVKEKSADNSKIIKKIDWKNSSLNDLVKGFGSAIDYKVVLVSKEKDKNVSFSVENEPVLSALDRLKTQVRGFALITVEDKSKTIYLNYN